MHSEPKDEGRPVRQGETDTCPFCEATDSLSGLCASCFTRMWSEKVSPMRHGQKNANEVSSA